MEAAQKQEDSGKTFFFILNDIGGGCAGSWKEQEDRGRENFSAVDPNSLVGCLLDLVLRKIARWHG